MVESNGSEIKTSVTLNFDDYRHFNLHHGRMTFILGGIIYFGVFLLLQLVLGLQKTKGLSSLISAVPIGIGLSLFILIILYVLTVNRVKSLYKKGVLSDKPQEYLVNENGIELVTEAGNGKVKWAEISKVCESKRLVIFYLAGNQALIIPKRFLDKGKMDSLKLVLKKSLPAGKIKIV